MALWRYFLCLLKKISHTGGFGSSGILRGTFLSSCRATTVFLCQGELIEQGNFRWQDLLSSENTVLQSLNYSVKKLFEALCWQDLLFSLNEVAQILNFSVKKTFRWQDLLFSENIVAQILNYRDGRRWLWSKTRRCRWFLSSSKWLQDFKKHQCRCPRTLTTLRLANTIVADVLALNNLKTWKQKYVAYDDLTRLER